MSGFSTYGDRVKRRPHADPKIIVSVEADHKIDRPLVVRRWRISIAKQWYKADYFAPEQGTWRYRAEGVTFPFTFRSAWHAKLVAKGIQRLLDLYSTMIDYEVRG